MNYENGFILQKDVNWSLLREGFTINVSVFQMFQTWDPSVLVHGSKRDIKILLNDKFSTLRW